MPNQVGWLWTIKRWHSWFLAKLVDRTSPRIAVLWAIKKLIAFYGIRLDDSRKELLSFRSVNDFFTREMKEAARPIDRRPDIIVSPVDGTVQSFGQIKDNELLQAKAIRYPLQQLVPSERVQRFADGFFVTIYLSPRDGHRIFSHCDGLVSASCRVPGLLYKVREPNVSRVHGLYALNERLITFQDTSFGPTALIAVAALNVARITAVYDNTIVTNQRPRRIMEKNYSPGIPFRRADHMATFNLGSTVILLFPKGVVSEILHSEGEPIKYGSALLRLQDVTMPERT